MNHLGFCRFGGLNGYNARSLVNKFDSFFGKERFRMKFRYLMTGLFFLAVGSSCSKGSQSTSPPPPTVPINSPGSVTSQKDKGAVANNGQSAPPIDANLTGPNAVKSVPIFLDIARNANGSIKDMSQADALAYCECQGEAKERLGCTTAPFMAHLPSARELAQLSMSLGAKGIAEIESGRPDDSYGEIKAINADGSSDNFYFSYEGYRIPSSELRHEGIWSASVNPNHNNSVSPNYNNSKFAFMFNGGVGNVVDIYREIVYVEVRCVASR